jgi:hypothetical protein
MGRFRFPPSYRSAGVKYTPYGPKTITTATPLPTIYEQNEPAAQGAFYPTSSSRHPPLHSKFFSDPYFQGAIAF